MVSVIIVVAAVVVVVIRRRYRVLLVLSVFSYLFIPPSAFTMAVQATRLDIYGRFQFARSSFNITLGQTLAIGIICRQPIKGRFQSIRTPSV